ncbi:thioredoxin-disulfide reductase [Coprothermobacteraceae bacterium]|nr:thioredoxin-disulfide reductase [Coprothermobacteraceae bacterium]
MEKYDVLVIGGGPAGLTAGLYGARNGLNVAVVHYGFFGGTVMDAYVIENYPGFPDGVSGPDLSKLFEEHARKAGAHLIEDYIEEIRREEDSWVAVGGLSYAAKTLILAMGVKHKELGVRGEKAFLGRGVSYCATCDGAFFRNKVVAVVGGGSTALSSAEYMANIASKVYLIHRRDEFRGEKVLADRVLANPKVEAVLNKTVKEIYGDAKVTGVTLWDTKTGDLTELPVDGVFIEIGYAPRTEVVRGLVELDEGGYVITDNALMTSVPGIFAAGDLRSGALGQIVTAAADGAVAAASAFKYIKENNL